MTLIQPTVEINLDGVWTDITSYVSCERDAITIKRGQADEQPSFEASIATFTLNNADGRFSPRNPTGPYYGVIGRNTPVRIKIGSNNRFYGEISAWPTVWDESGNVAWTTVQAAGIVRRLAQGAAPLSGPLEFWVGAQGGSAVVGYWPMTDPVGSSTMASALSGGPPMVLEGASLPTLAANDDFAASDPLPVLNNGSFRAAVSSGTYTSFLLSVPVAGDTNDTTLFRVLTTGTVDRWELRYFTAGTLVVRGFTGGASVVTSGAIGALNGVPSFVRFHWYQNGGNVDWWCVTYSYATGAQTATVSGSIAGTAGVAEQIQFNSDRAAAEIAVGQLVVMSSDLYPAIGDAYLGYVGETAGRRIERLCDEQDVAFSSSGDLDDTVTMGPQTSGTFLENLKACQAVDMGYLYEPRSALGIEYRTRESLYDQAATCTLAYTNLYGVQPVEDDQSTRNDVTVSRVGGSSARYEVTTGPLSVNAPPDGVGRYRDEVPPLVIETDAQLQNQAEWRATVGTIDEPRYPELVTDINQLAGATKTAAISLGIGDRLTVTGMPVWVPPNSIDVHVVGYTETIRPHEWMVEYVCVPASPYLEAFVLDDTTNGRLDSSTTTLNEDLDTTETGVDYTGDTWITTASHPSEFPFDIMIGGERMTVTSAVAGTFTVTRSVNGVVKEHATGTEIHVYQRNRLAL